MSKENSKRIVQVFVVDLHPDAPPESAILYATDKPFLTDLTDQELYFGIDLKGRVEAYNSLRTTWKDKKATRQAGKDVFLEPLKIRELGMVVTELAKF